MAHEHEQFSVAVGGLPLAPRGSLGAQQLEFHAVRLPFRQVVRQGRRRVGIFQNSSRPTPHGDNGSQGLNHARERLNLALQVGDPILIRHPNLSLVCVAAAKVEAPAGASIFPRAGGDRPAPEARP